MDSSTGRNQTNRTINKHFPARRPRVLRPCSSCDKILTPLGLVRFVIAARPVARVGCFLCLCVPFGFLVKSNWIQPYLQETAFKCGWFDEKDYFEFFPLTGVYMPTFTTEAQSSTPN